jgi:hypothetical protein
MRIKKRRSEKDRLFTRLKLESVHQPCSECPRIMHLEISGNGVAGIKIQGFPCEEVAAEDLQVEVLINLDIIDQVKLVTDSAVIPERSILIEGCTIGVSMSHGIADVEGLNDDLINRGDLVTYVRFDEPCSAECTLTGLIVVVIYGPSLASGCAGFHSVKYG